MLRQLYLLEIVFWVTMVDAQSMKQNPLLEICKFSTFLLQSIELDISFLWQREIKFKFKLF